MMPATPGAVVVYRFEDGAVIERLLTAEAIAAVLPPETSQKCIAQVQTDAEEGFAALYALRLSRNPKAQSIGYFQDARSKVSEWPSPKWGFVLMDLMRVDQSAYVFKTTLQRSYWMPFIEDTAMPVGQIQARWNGFRQPSFIDDRLYEQLAEDPDDIEDRIAALSTENLDLPLIKKINALGLQWLKHGFRGSNEMQGIVDIQAQSSTGTLLFELEGWPGGPLFFWVGVDLDEAAWEISTNAGDTVARGATPLEALQNARKDFLANRTDQEIQTILPMSEQQAWFEQNYMVGAPTFDMEVYYLLSTPGPVPQSNAWFITWAAQEFGP